MHEVRYRSDPELVGKLLVCHDCGETKDLAWMWLPDVREQGVGSYTEVIRNLSHLEDQHLGDRVNQSEGWKQ